MTAPYLTFLDAEGLAREGIPDGWSFGMADRVRFAELDALNHVNNAAYLSWFEALRVHYVSAYGLSDYRPEDPELVLRDVACRYHAPMFLNERYIVTARTARYRRTSFTMEYAVFAETLRATGSAVIVCLARDGSGRAPLADAVVGAFRARDGAVPET